MLCYWHAVIVVTCGVIEMRHLPKSKGLVTVLYAKTMLYANARRDETKRDKTACSSFYTLKAAY
jgi:hypothetical protein